MAIFHPKLLTAHNDDYCELIYECLYEEGVARYSELSDIDFKKLIQKQYNYIRKIAKEGFYNIGSFIFGLNVELSFFMV